ncbi:IS3 family transposase [Candidatus Margulisiibacteriota bacterium]
MSVKTQSKYDQDFRQEAVELALHSDKSAAQIAKDLGVNEATLYYWIRKNKNRGEDVMVNKNNRKTRDSNEVRKLRKELEDTKLERDNLKKSSGHLLKTTEMKFVFIKHHHSEFPVKKMCQVLKVSKSGFYTWLNRKPSTRQVENNMLLVEIEKVFIKSRKCYGYPRVHKELVEKGMHYNKKRIARLMKGRFQAKMKKRFKITTHSNHNFPVAPNILKRNFTAEKLNQIWTSDITYIRTDEGWLYLAVILDIFSRKIIGWHMNKRLTKELVIKALNNALRRRNYPTNIIFHSDQGVQYASHEFRKILEVHKFIQSMSNKGNCYDNAITETFFHTLKTEHVYFEQYETREKARRSIFDYIEIFYNRERRHSSINYMSPENFERLKMAA